MTKEEAKQKLRKSGYTVVDDNSVVTVYISPEKNIKNAIRDIKEKLYSWGYNASFGVKQHKGAEDAADDIMMDAEATTDEELMAEPVEEQADISVNKESESSAKEDKKASELKIKLSDIINDDPVDDGEKVVDNKKSVNDEQTDEDEWFDEEDSDMLLTEESIQFSLEDFGLDF